jgi:uncharacterized protein
VTLGKLYEGGKGVLQDNFLAFKYYEQGAITGYRDAQANLGRMYAQGLGVTQNYVLAYKWLNLGALDNREEHAKVARQWRDYVALGMTSDQVSEAQELSRKWKPSTLANADFDVSETKRHPVATAIELTSTGSGFVVSSQGYVLTNYHVVEACLEVRVPDASGASTLPAIVAAFDAENDLAVLRLSAPVTSVADFANNGPKPGQEVIAVGYPLRGLLGL